MTPFSRSRVSGVLTVPTLLRAVTAVGLLIDARLHLKLAAAYDSIKTSILSQGELFRIEAGAALIAAVLIVVVRKRVSAIIALMVAGGGLVALLVYRYFDLGAIGPLPPMYEPAWYADKVTTCIAQAVAAMAALAVPLSLSAGRHREQA